MSPRATRRDPAGLTPLLEARIIEAAALTARRRATEAGRARQSAGAELNLLRGEPPSAPPPRVPRPELRLGPLPPLPTLLAGARERNFELRARRVDLAQGSLRVKLSRNERFPAVTTGPYFTQERADSREFYAGFNLSVPLPIFDQNQGNIRSAEARRQQADVSLSLAERQVERQIAERLSAYEARRWELDRIRPDSVEQFGAAAELGDRNYRLGAIPVSTYVELQDKYLEALTAILDTQREALEDRQQIDLLTGRNAEILDPKAKATAKK